MGSPIRIPGHCKFGLLISLLTRFILVLPLFRFLRIFRAPACVLVLHSPSTSKRRTHNGFSPITVNTVEYVRVSGRLRYSKNLRECSLA